MTSLEVKSVSKSYNNRVACRDINLRFDQGKITGIFGANGAGKSTSFHMISGLIRPDSGSIFLGSDDISHLALYQRASFGLGFLPQDESVFRGLTVEQNLQCMLQLCHLTKAERQQRLEYLINAFSLSKVRFTLGHLLSGGERRRTEIARAMANKPKFLLLDEPFSGVDPISIQEIKTLLKTIQKNDGVGVVITDHNVVATLPMCDYAFIMHLGKVIAEGPPQEIANNSLARKHYLGDSLDAN
tara:strand:+ start:1968 stop:2696 length:729 start_codon:yes stop_codon:yes gene_type:complete